MLYYNAMMPQHMGPSQHQHVSTKSKKKNKKRKVSYPVKWRKHKPSLSCYFKHIFWRTIRRLWRKRKLQKKKKAQESQPIISKPKHSISSTEKIDARDFWGSKYGSEWLFKDKRAEQNRLVEIIDAFKAVDLKYSAKKHPLLHTGNKLEPVCKLHGRQRRMTQEKSLVRQLYSHRNPCPCSHQRTLRPKRDSKCNSKYSDSEWSVASSQFEPRPYSRWPPSQPRKLKPVEEPLSSVLSRMNVYLYNWVYVDKMQLSPSSQFVQSLNTLERYQRKLKRHYLKQSSSASVKSSCSSTCCSQRHISKNPKEMYSRWQKRARKKAKEHASVLWLLSKAFDGSIPSDLQQPFYRNHEQHRKLKPKLVHALANAELYCLALANIYSDPNFHNLDHHGVIQALTRKGICLVETRDAPLTETILMQTAPLKMNAHMAVIDGMISLYIKEVLIPEKIVDVVKEFSHVDLNGEMPSNPEEAAVLWINKCCVRLQSEISNAIGSHESFEKQPRIPVLQEIADISDGCSLAAVISFYCPAYLRWQDITFNEPMSLGDSIYNLQLVKRFCCDNLPRHIDCLTLEDLLYVHPSIKDNVLVFVAELLFSFVIWPTSCVSRHISGHESREHSHASNDGHKTRSSSIPSHKMHQALGNAIPNLRSDSYGGSTSSLPELRAGNSSQVDSTKDSSEKAQKKSSASSHDRIRMSPQLHRARSSGVVNGFKSNDASLLSLANSGDNELRFSGGSQQEILMSKVHMATKDRQKFSDSSKDDECLRARRSFSDVPGQNSCLNSGLRDYYHSLATCDGPVRSGSLSNIRENKVYESPGNERPSFKGHDSTSSQSSGICVSELDKNHSRTSFAQHRDPTSNAINIIYMQQDKDGRSRKPLKPNLLQRPKPEKHTTFAALPNTTTWQKLALSSSSSQADSGHETPINDSVNPSLRVKLAVIRMQLDEKRRDIELKKKHLEACNKKQRQKLGKVAFLQAVGISEVETPDSGTGKEIDESEPPPVPEKAFDVQVSSPSLVRRMSIQEIAEDLDSIQKKWLERREASAVGQRNLSDISADADDSLMNSSDYQASIEQLNSSLYDLQADISRIRIEQEHVENLMQDSVEDASFYLHGHPKESMLDSLVKVWGPSSLQSTPVGREPSRGFASTPKSPIRQIYHRPAFQKQTSFTRESSFSPSRHDHHVNVEDLYSKVVKPENREKTKTPRVNYSLPEQQSVHKSVQQRRMESSPRKGSLAARQHSYDSSPQRATPPAMEQRQNVPEVPPKQSLTAAEQGFYISFDDQPKKLTTKWTRPQINGNKTNQPSQKTDLDETNSYGFVIGADLVHPDPETEVEMAKKKEQIMNLSIRRRADHESRRAIKEQEYAKLREEEQRKRELAEKKREEERKRREAILEQYRQRKLQDTLDEEIPQDTQSTGKTMGISKTRSSSCLQRRIDNRICSDFTKPIAELRNQVALQRRNRPAGRTRPKSAYVNSSTIDRALVDGSVANKRNSQFIGQGKGTPEFDIDSLNSTSTDSYRDRERSPSNEHRGALSQSSSDRGLRPPEIGIGGCSSDGASDTTSNSSNIAMASEYTGPKLFVKPASKSNRSIIINAMHTVLAGSVNAETKKKVLEEINKSESKHFLILFRGAGCQFRALYSYNPDTGEVLKMYGIGPKSVSDKVMERFYKYNSGGKCFSEIQTKHLTVTIDAFTIPNSLWAGKKVVPPRKEFL